MRDPSRDPSGRAGARAGSCASSALERPRYFPRQLVTQDELTQDQEYVRARLRLHNRMLWGWGTVCGTEVCRVPLEPGSTEQDPWKVLVKPGFLIGPYGDEILIDRAVDVDLRTAGTGGAAGDATDPSAADPWCSRVCLPREPGPRCIAVRYDECLTRPVRVQPAGCGCEGEDCEYSRIRDGYEIGILDHCPESHAGPPPDLEDLFEGAIPPCPPCPDEPWVVLACVEVGEDGIEGEPDNCSCRRMVVSFGSYWWRCGEGERDTVVIDEVRLLDQNGAVHQPPMVVSQGAHFTADLLAPGIEEAEEVETDEALAVRDWNVDPGVLHLQAQVRDGAEPGTYGVRVILPDAVAEVHELVSVRAVKPAPGGVSITDVTIRRGNLFASNRLSAGDGVTVTIDGENLGPHLGLDLGNGVEVREPRMENGHLMAEVTVLEGASLGPRPLRLVTASGEVVAERGEVLEVVPRSEDSGAARAGASGRNAKRGGKKATGKKGAGKKGAGKGAGGGGEG